MDALRAMGVSGDAVRNAVNELVSKNTEEESQSAAEVRMDPGAFMGMGGQPSADDGSMLEKYGRNLTKLAESGKLDPVLDRDR